jgi:hypothetical protein
MDGSRELPVDGFGELLLKYPTVKNVVTLSNHRWSTHLSQIDSSRSCYLSFPVVRIMVLHTSCSVASGPPSPERLPSSIPEFLSNLLLHSEDDNQEAKSIIALPLLHFQHDSLEFFLLHLLYFNIVPFNEILSSALGYNLFINCLRWIEINSLLCMINNREGIGDLC